MSVGTSDGISDELATSSFRSRFGSTGAARREGLIPVTTRWRPLLFVAAVIAGSSADRPLQVVGVA
jgi:hypothetical protein